MRAILAADMSIIKSESLGPLHGYESRATHAMAAGMHSLAHEWVSVGLEERVKLDG